MPDKPCQRCRKWLSYESYTKQVSAKDGLCPVCRECKAQCNLEWRKRHHEENLERKRAYYYEHRERILKRRAHNLSHTKRLAVLRQEVFNHYGNKCYCCGLSDPRFLTIEHLSNDGSALRYKNGSGSRTAGTTMYRQIIDAGFPADIALACYNCNCARSFHSKGQQCPHTMALPDGFNVETYFIDLHESRLKSGFYKVPAWVPDDVRDSETSETPQMKARKSRAKPFDKGQSKLFVG